QRIVYHIKPPPGGWAPARRPVPLPVVCGCFLPFAAVSCRLRLLPAVCGCLRGFPASSPCSRLLSPVSRCFPPLPHPSADFQRLPLSDGYGGSSRRSCPRRYCSGCHCCSDSRPASHVSAWSL